MRLRWATREDAALLAITATGLAIFFAPLLVGRAFPQSTALFTALIACAALAILAVGLQTRHLSTRLLAVLAALIAIDATLRLVIVIGLLGFSPIFFLMIVGGFVMGPSFGFALGALTLLLSAVLTAGFGPWLPYQMLAAGWVGMGAGYIGRFGPMSTQARRLAVLITLALYGVLAGFAYGMLLDLWEWPFLLGAASSPISWAPGLALPMLLRRFGIFYLTTSLVYDGFRAAGNVLLIATLGGPVIAALARFRRRFLVIWTGPQAAEPVTVANMAEHVGTAS
jgi:energy-coupling factor transport system substrate-specific component